jgi:hypothetical protein
MAEQNENPSEQKPTRNQETIDDLLWEIPFARPVWNFFVREGKAVKSGWVAVLLMVGLAIWITHSKTTSGVDGEISDITNAFNGQISDLKGQLGEARHESEHYEEMLAPFQAMAIAKYTNAPLDQRLDLLTASMTSFTNFLQEMESERPKLELTVNGVKLPYVENAPGVLVNGTPILTKKTDDIIIETENISAISAPHIVMDFISPIDTPNLAFSGWEQQPKNELGFNHWNIVSDISEGQFQTFLAQPLKISANFNAPYLYAQIYYHADNSMTYESAVTLIFTNQ